MKLHLFSLSNSFLLSFLIGASQEISLTNYDTNNNKSGGIKKRCSLKEKRPEIIIHKSGSLEDFPSADSVEPFDSSFELIYQQKSVECVHDSPIDFITNVDSNNEGDFKIQRNFYQIRKSSYNKADANMKNQTYSVYLIFQYTTKSFKNPLLISCQPIRMDNKCQRTLLEITPGKYAPIFNVSFVPSTKIFKNLSDALLTPIKMRNKSTSDCEIIMLYIKETPGNGLQYKWITISNRSKILNEKVVSTNQGIVYRSWFRHIKQERSCVKLLNSSEECINCSPVQTEQGKLNSVAFYAKLDDNNNTEVEMFYKGVFNLSSTSNGSRKFYLDWNVKLVEMISFKVPSLVYVNQSVEIKCSVSVTYFAYGTVIHTDYESLRDSPLDEHESYKSDGRREVTKNITIKTDGDSVNIICSAPLWNYTRHINVSKTVSVQIAEIPIFLKQSVSEEIILVEPNELNFVICCEAFGKPIPNLEWKLPHHNTTQLLKINAKTDLENNIAKSTITFPEFLEEFIGAYNCVASNYLRTISKTYNVQLQSHGLSKGTKAGISFAFVALLLLFSVIIFMRYRKIVKQRKEYQTKTTEAIHEFKEGISLKDASATMKRKLSHHLAILEKPYNDEFELPQEKWILSDKFLGSGRFGFVRQAAVQLNNGNIQSIAVKMLKSCVEIEDFKGFLTELKIMAYLKNHPNVVSLVAACTQNIDQRIPTCDVMIGVEICVNGNLNDYLVNNRCMFELNISQCVQNTIRTPTYANVESSGVLTEHDLFRWSFEIACGMEFLASKQVLHGDLATRNILLDSEKTAKISDFGLSRVLISSNYTKKSRVPVPWRAMALESHNFQSFSSASDAWGYGVTIWEIYSFGEMPYANLHFSMEFIQQLEMGLRLTKPKRATDEIYQIMKECWNPDVTQRMTFPQLKTAFSKILQSLGPLPSPISKGKDSLSLEIDTLWSLNASPTSKSFQNLYSRS